MNLRKVKDVAENIQYGYTESSSKEIIGPKFLRITDIQDESVDWDSVPYCKISNKEKSKYLLKDGDLVFARTGATVGKSYLIQGEIPETVFASYLIRLRFSKEVLGKYVSYFFKSPSYWNQISEGQVGAGQANVNGTKLGNLLIPLPPLLTQRAIADHLDRADALRQKDRQLLQAYDDLAQSVFVEMFGEEKKFKRLGLAEICSNPEDIRCGPFGTQLYASDYIEAGVPLWSIRQVNLQFRIPTKEFITLEKAASLSQYNIVENDIVMTRKATVGNCAIYPRHLPEGIMHSDLLRIRVNQSLVNPVFLTSQLRYSTEIQRQIDKISVGAITNGINVSKLKSLVVSSPPLPLQTRFAAVLANIERQKDLVRQQQAQSEALFGRLLQEAFGGDPTLLLKKSVDITG